MNGVIGFTSRSNKGSCSFIKLPICHLPADPQKQEETCNQTSLEEKEDHQNLTLLYIEDNPMNLARVKKFLKQDRPGIKFLSAPDAKRVLKLARDNLADLILMDINLPPNPSDLEIIHHSPNFISP